MQDEKHIYSVHLNRFLIYHFDLKKKYKALTIFFYFFAYLLTNVKSMMMRATNKKILTHIIEIQSNLQNYSEFMILYNTIK